MHNLCTCIAEQSLAEIAARPDPEHSTASGYRVLYDGQCEICQGCVAWLKTLDRENKTLSLAISPVDSGFSAQTG